MSDSGPRGGELTCRVVGLGGIGQVVAQYLTLFLNSLGRSARVILIDGDAYEDRNMARMFIPAYANKASAVQADLADRLAPGCVTLLAIAEHVTAANVARLIPSGPDQFVLSCVDNHATRKLLSDHAAGLGDVCLISGGNDGVGPDSSGHVQSGTAGNVQVYIRRGGRDVTAPLTKYHPEIERPADKRPDELSCGEILASGSAPQILFTNVMAAAWMLSAFWLVLQERLGYCEMVFDVALARATPLSLPGPLRASPAPAEMATVSS